MEIQASSRKAPTAATRESVIVVAVVMVVGESLDGAVRLKFGCFVAHGLLNPDDSTPQYSIVKIIVTA